MAESIRSAARSGDERRLAAVIAHAKKGGLPKSRVDRALQGSSSAASDLETVIYEGTLPGGLLVMVQALTDKRSRTAPEVRHAFRDAGGALGAPGCASWAFRRLAWLQYPVSPSSSSSAISADEREMALIEKAMEAGASDIASSSEAEASVGPEDHFVDVWVEPAEAPALRETMSAQGHTPSIDQLVYAPNERVALSDEDQAVLEEALDSFTVVYGFEEAFHNGE